MVSIDVIWLLAVISFVLMPGVFAHHFVAPHAPSLYISGCGIAYTSKMYLKR